MWIVVRLLSRYAWAWPLFGVAALAGGAWTLWTASHPVFITRTATLNHYYLHGGGTSNARYELSTNEEPWQTYQLAGTQAGAPLHVLKGGNITMTYVQGTTDLVGLTAADVPDADAVTHVGTQAVTVAWKSEYYYQPNLYTESRRGPSLALMAGGLVLLSFFGFFRYIYKPPTTTGAIREAERLATVDYGPHTPRVAALLQQLAHLAESDWVQLGEACFRNSFGTGGDPAARARLHAAATAGGRLEAAGRAQAAAERLVTRHPPVRDITGMDMRSLMSAPVGMAAAALATVDLISAADFDELYAGLAHFVPLDMLEVRPGPPGPMSPPLQAAPA